jgi:hypothetical protein
MASGKLFLIFEIRNFAAHKHAYMFLVNIFDVSVKVRIGSSGNCMDMDY